MGGEKVALVLMLGGFVGSPPRRRGKVRICFCFGEKLRITPAWAGKRFVGAAPRTSGRDHPRMGREKAADTCVYYSVTGSPPRGRGKEAGRRPVHRPDRITPAWAGKSLHENAAAAVPGDHPRVDGEKFPASVPPVYGPGSPPRGRGKDSAGSLDAVRVRITPAWAGKSFLRVDVHEIPGDHPRVGGEKF